MWQYKTSIIFGLTFSILCTVFVCLTYFLPVLVLLPVCIIVCFLVGFFIHEREIHIIKSFTKLLTNSPSITKIPRHQIPPGEVGHLMVAFTKLQDQLEDNLNRQQLFMANAAHELKNPLSRITSTLDLVDVDSPQIKLAKQELLNLSGMLDDLLIHTSLPHDTPNLTNTDLKVLIADLLTLRSIELLSQNITVTINCPPGIKIFVNPKHFKILLHNLFSNALKYNQPNGTIAFSVRQSNFVRLDITNTGKGLVPYELKKIFDPFYRSPKDRNKPGFGLGMAIVKQICTLNNYHLSIDSKPNVYTSVHISHILPALITS